MAVSARKHIVPAAAETSRRQAINDLAASVNDIIPVANATERAQLVADVVAAGHVWPRPLYVDRADAPAGAKLERTTDGTTWAPDAYTRVSHQVMGAPPGGADVPAVAVSDVTRMMRKTGVATFTTTASFGNEYSPVIVFAEAFPTALLYVSMTQIHAGAQIAFSGAMATDRASKVDFRAAYVGSSTPTPRGFLWEAVGY
jgi:hypothetical protein